jgi:stress-induced morphogen
MNDQSGRIESLLQSFDQIAIEFDHMHLTNLIQQQARHRGEAGADLHHGVVALRIDGANDVVQHKVIGQEVLAEAFAGDMFH